MSDRLPARLTSRVVGVTFCDGYPDNLGRIELALRRHELFGGDPTAVAAELERDPGNEFDPNAIKVLVYGEQIGHIDRRTAERLAPRLDAGEEWDAVVADVVVRREDPSSPGVSVTLTRRH